MICYESSNCAISIAFNFDTQRKRRKEKRKNLKIAFFFHFPIESHKVLGEFELAYLITKKKKKAEMIWNVDLTKKISTLEFLTLYKTLCC